MGISRHRRDLLIRFRATSHEDAEFQAAADAAGLTKSAWMRMHLLRVARLEAAQKPVPYPPATAAPPREEPALPPAAPLPQPRPDWGDLAPPPPSPAVADAAPEADPAPPTPATAAGDAMELAGGSGGRTVVVAEDDSVTAALVIHRLEREGFRVRHFVDGVAVLAARVPDVALFILDGKMPGLDGFTVLRQLKADPATRNVPVLMLTGMGREEDVVRAFELGADDYIVKPFSPIEMLARIRYLLARGTGRLTPGEGR